MDGGNEKSVLRCEPHPISGFIYRELGGGRVRVEDAAQGRYGIFNWDGIWLEGELTHADPHLLIYIGGPNVPPGWDLYWPMMPVQLDENHPPPPPDPQAEAAAAQAPRIIGKYVPDPGKKTADGMRSAADVDQDFLLAHDRHPERIPEIYRVKAPMPGGPEKVGTARFLERKYHDLEVEKLWKKTWQMVCREDDIPNIGDYYLYEIASLAFLIVRTGAQEFKAHYNACLHRGRPLRDCHGKQAHEFRCPFHGWTWNIEGKLKHITAEWDFPGVREEVSQLPGAKVATWGGFIFINPDPDAGSLEAFMGPEMIAHYAKFKLENRYKQAHVSRVINANWKVVLEAFSESYHVIATHPQLLLMGGDFGNSHYDVFGNWGRLGHVQNCTASPLRDVYLTQDQVLANYRFYADYSKAFLKSVIGDEVEQFSDAELNDITYSTLFPNFAPWGGFGRILYRWRPHGDNHEQCLMEAMFLAPWPEGKPKPPPAEVRALGPGESWTNAPELVSFGRILDQDVLNLERMQAGLKTKQPPHVWYSSYQEGVLRNFHQIYARTVGLSE